MSTEANKATVRRWYLELFSQGDLSLADELCTADYLNHDIYTPPGGWPRGPEGTKAIVTTYRAAFPDVHFTIDDQVAEGDKVVTRWTGRGTNKGPLMGMPPTGKTMTASGISIERFTGGKIAEVWVNFDLLGMLQQLGLVPSPGG